MKANFVILVMLFFTGKCVAQDTFTSIDNLESLKKSDSTLLAGIHPLYIVDSLVTDYESLNKMDPRFIHQVEFVEPIDIRCGVYGARAQYGIVFITLGAKKETPGFSVVRKRRFVR